MTGTGVTGIYDHSNWCTMEESVISLGIDQSAEENIAFTWKCSEAVRTLETNSERGLGSPRS
jgi:hypothetical protein